MKNTWLHSAVVVALGIAALVAAAQAFAFVLGGRAESAAYAPAQMFAWLAPGLGLGWFTRRHPLVVGAIAGVLAQALFPATSAPSPAGQAIAAGMVVAVAALAGRALRFRYRPA
jgi:hypothetical protein